MNRLMNFSRSAVLLILVVFLSACSQTTTGVSSYGGKLGQSKSLSKDQRQLKLLAARKRAKAKRVAEQAAFVARRKARRDARKSKSYIKPIKRKKLARKALKKKTRRFSRVKRLKRKRIKRNLRKIARNKRSKSRVKRIKKSTYSYVGGRSKGIRRSGPWRCVPRNLKKVISQISRKFGRVIINSTHRSRKRNRRVGGKRRSYHLRCRAIDFRVQGRTRGLTRWLSRHPLVGGYKRYRSGYYHIDNGPRRTW